MKTTTLERRLVTQNYRCVKVGYFALRGSPLEEIRRNWYTKIEVMIDLLMVGGIIAIYVTWQMSSLMKEY